MWVYIEHFAQGPTADYQVPSIVQIACNEDPNCEFVYANGQNMYTCGPYNSQSGYEESIFRDGIKFVMPLLEFILSK
jgi:hypothetical protein